MSAPMVTAQLVDASGTPLSAANPLVVAAGPSEQHVGQVGGTTKVITAALNRPADVAAYAVGDLIGTATAAGQRFSITVEADVD